MNTWINGESFQIVAKLLLHKITIISLDFQNVWYLISLQEPFLTCLQSFFLGSITKILTIFTCSTQPWVLIITILTVLSYITEILTIFSCITQPRVFIITILGVLGSVTKILTIITCITHQWVRVIVILSVLGSIPTILLIILTRRTQPRVLIETSWKSWAPSHIY